MENERMKEIDSEIDELKAKQQEIIRQIETLKAEKRQMKSEARK